MLICGDYLDSKGSRITVIPFGRTEWECMENLRATARSEGTTIYVRREPCVGDGIAMSTTPQSPSAYINASGDVRESGSIF
jgi:hypothetical protein